MTFALRHILKHHTRSYHDCPINALQPLRLLLLGSPVSFYMGKKKNSRWQLTLYTIKGSGKGTQSERLKANFGVSHLSSGDLLRKNINQHTLIGQQAAEYVSQGKLVPDNLLVSLVDRELAHVGGVSISNKSVGMTNNFILFLKKTRDCQQNWLLDGFPRTVKQAHALDKTLERLMQPLNLVIHLEVPEQVILGRIMGKWSCLKCGSNVFFYRSMGPCSFRTCLQPVI